jgi:hypothetical protein
MGWGVKSEPTCVACQTAATAVALGTEADVIRSLHAQVDRLLSEQVEVAELRARVVELEDIVRRQNKHRTRRTA